ncbi:alpha/beta fold hydrolase [Halobacillus salinus]|uniref:Alpha/beta fold hydrolase n=1 Tax=Halobacillus salinus TaxID=192814 RepID=A0A4Z0H5B1_9BACI|nr:alpha/beta hydrolase [Halobacillus salinus]TGB04385.1 alpha/beta fold hydrolase [Halobacillus salinus]
MILHTHRQGKGEPVVFLHTGLETGATDFEEQQSYFAAKYDVIAPDLRGHGRSSHNDFEDYFHKSADDLKETLDSLNVTRAHIVGCSLGALVALFFARKHEKYVNSLTISGLMPGKPDNWKEMHKQDSTMQAMLLENEEAVSFLDQQHDSDWRAFIHMAKDESWYPFEETEDLSDIKSPVLFMVGEGNQHEVQGATFYPNQSERVQVAVLPFASHLVHVQQPDIYSQILSQFLVKSAPQMQRGDVDG